MIYTFDELYNEIYEKINQVYSIFQGFFGEDKTDLQNVLTKEELKIKLIDKGYPVNDNDTIELTSSQLAHVYTYIPVVDILVYFPEVTITNEYHNSIVITDLYSKVKVTVNGTIPYEYRGFTLNRATYNKAQFTSGYMHSHIRCIPSHDFTEFQEPCLGTGPIKNTIATLKNQNDEVMWLLFCREMDMYVTVESIKGVPYHRMADVSDKGVSLVVRSYWYNYSRYCVPSNHITEALTMPIIRAFIAYYIEHGHMTFNYIDGSFCPGLPIYDYVLDVSNSFIEFYNTKHLEEVVPVSRLFDNNILEKLISKDRKLYSLRANNNRFLDITHCENAFICRFKNREVRLHIEQANTQETDPSIIALTVPFSEYILNRILTIINYNFCNEQQSDSNSQSSTVEEKCLYI